MRAGLGLALAGVAMCGTLLVRAQSGVPSAPMPKQQLKARELSDRLADKPSLPPAFSIPVEPLGFSAPGPIYLGAQNSLASLDFIDENRLLFTFRAPGLIHRQFRAGESEEENERQIRAVVLTLPAGGIESEAVWTVHDRGRYLWMLRDGHFLLRDRNTLSEGNAALDLKPALQFPGPLLWLEMDPAQQLLVTDSREPGASASKASAAHPGDQSMTQATAAASMVAEDQNEGGEPNTVVRIIHRESGHVMLVSRVRSTVHLPINSDGYLESLRGNDDEWILNLNFFKGGSTILGRVESACALIPDFISEREVLVNACIDGGGNMLAALTTGGRALWENVTQRSSIRPLVRRSPDGLRLTLETLEVNHAISARAPLDSSDVKGQMVRVLDAATGDVALETPATPLLDAGGNVAISPSGRRVAVLNAGAIQVFDLPAPPPLPTAAADRR
jgi:hypothetical protein